MTDRDLNLRVTANAEQAKTELAEVQEAQQGLVTSTNQATTATTASTTALKDQGDAGQGTSDSLNDLGNAASVASLASQRLKGSTLEVAEATVQETVATETAVVAADAHVVAFRAEQAASAGVVLALQEARAAMSALAAATAIGGTEMAAALGRAAIAIAGVQAALAAAGGGTAAQQAGFALLNNQLASLVPTMAVAGKATAGFTENTKLLNLGTKAAGAAIAGHEISVARLATGLLKLAGPALGAVTVIALLPQVIKLVVEKTNEWSKSIGEAIVGLNEQGNVIRKAGESTEDYQVRVNAAADANEELSRASYAASKGVIGLTTDSAKLRAEWILHQEALHKGSQSAEALAFAFKTLGIKMTESLKFEDARLSVLNFVSDFDRHLKDGENSARRFASTNKENIQEWMEKYEDAGVAIPAGLQKIADKYDIVTDKQKETLKQAQDQLAAWESLTPKARALVEQSEEMPAAQPRWGEAFITPTVHIEELLKGIKKIGTEGVPSLAGAAKEIQAALKDVTSAAADADAALARLYDSEPLAPGDIQPGLAPGDWIG